MSRKFSTLAEIRSRNPRLSLAILNTVGLHRSVAPVSKRDDGADLFDEDMVIVAATVHATERELQSRGENIRSFSLHREVQYADSAKRLGL